MLCPKSKSCFLCAKHSQKSTHSTKNYLTHAPIRYAFTPGGCKGDPGTLTDPLQDIANFLLTRGPYAWLGHGTLIPCSSSFLCPHSSLHLFLSSQKAGLGARTNIKCRTKFIGTTANLPASARRQLTTVVSSFGTGPKPRSKWTATRGRPLSLSKSRHSQKKIFSSFVSHIIFL